MEFTGLQTMGAALITALAPTIYAYLKKGALDDVMGVVGSAAPVMTTYLRRKQGGFTTAEKEELADAVIELFEEIERVTGTMVINGPDNAWIEPVGTPTAVVTPEPEYLVYKIYPKMSDETFAFIMASLPDTEAGYIRQQVDAAEAAGLREYPLDTSRRRLLIRDGMLSGDYDIWEIPKEAK